MAPPDDGRRVVLVFHSSPMGGLRGTAPESRPTQVERAWGGGGGGAGRGPGGRPPPGLTGLRAERLPMTPPPLSVKRLAQASPKHPATRPARAPERVGGHHSEERRKGSHDISHHDRSCRRRRPGAGRGRPRRHHLRVQEVHLPGGPLQRRAARHPQGADPEELRRLDAVQRLPGRGPLLRLVRGHGPGVRGGAGPAGRSTGRAGDRRRVPVRRGYRSAAHQADGRRHPHNAADPSATPAPFSRFPTG